MEVTLDSAAPRALMLFTNATAIDGDKELDTFS
jgi:hypothetical protein